MKRFLAQLCYFLIGFVAISILLRTILPKKKYWGNEEYESKIEIFRKNKYNTVFFGSSRILTGIDPANIDSLFGESFHTSKSYNLATTGTWSNETFYLYEQFLTDPSLTASVDHVFME